MTQRGRSVLLLGLVVYVAAWAFGSKPLYPVAAGLFLVSALAWLVVRVGTREFRLDRRTGEQDVVEGDDVRVRVKVTPVGRPPLASVEIVEKIQRLGERRHTLRRFGDTLRIDYVLPGLRRGRYSYDGVHIELSDPFGLQRITISLPPPGALLVYPRIVRLQHLFSDARAQAQDGRRVLVRRQSGFDFQSVREYIEGESLRRVHWPSTARRGQLMMKELEDAPRDEVAVLLDTDVRAVVGESFETQVRAAGSLLELHVRRGRRAVLVANDSITSDWRHALDVLAEVEPRSEPPRADVLGPGSRAGRALELVLVTARVDAAVVDRLVHRALAHRRVSVVFVHAATFAGAPASRQPALLRLQAAGIPVAVVRAGEDLRVALELHHAVEAMRA